MTSTRVACTALNAWNLFGLTDAPMFSAVLDAMLEAAR